MSARAYRSWRRRDKARDQNRVAANLRRVQEVLEVHVALIGHKAGGLKTHKECFLVVLWLF